MQSPDLFAKALALLAFLTAFYALAARERKTPYITNTLYSTLYFILLSLVASLISASLSSIQPALSLWLGRIASILFILCIVLVSLKLWKLQNRHIHLRDDHLLRNTIVVRKVKSLFRSIWRAPTYEHHPQVFPEALITCLSTNALLGVSNLQRALKRSVGRFSPSVYAEVRSLADADAFLVDLARCFLHSDCNVQYSTSARHPLELLLQLKVTCQEKGVDWRTASQRIVAVDAYTAHFGFTDSNFLEATKQLKELGVMSVPAAPTFAGLHTAAAKAFNVMKKRSPKQPRSPTLVIYEGTFSLTDLESLEQYRIFLRHVLPSERMWGGMLTVVLEGLLPPDVKALLIMYADINVTLPPNVQVGDAA